MTKATCILYWLHDDSCSNPWVDGYIGITFCFKHRMYQHRYSKSRSSKRIPKDFRTQILFNGTLDECSALETKMRSHPDIGWNIASGGNGCKRQSETSKQKLRDAIIARGGLAGANHPRFGTHCSEETKQRLSIPCPETKKQKIRDAILARAAPGPWLGKQLSETTKQKLREARLGKRHSEASKQKMRQTHATDITKQKFRATIAAQGGRSGANNSFFGKHHSEASKQKMREAELGKRASEATKQKMSASRLGKPRSEATKRKIREAWIIRRNRNTPGFYDDQ